MTAAQEHLACIGEPISWLRLEQFARAHADTVIETHLGACPACRACLDEIERDVVALPPLHLSVEKPRRRWWSFAVPAGLALAAAAILLLVLRPRDQPHDQGAAARGDTTQVKGVGTLELGVVRERDGSVREDVSTFAPGDRWKVVVTCAASHTVWVQAFVVEGTRADYPLAPSRIVCGNRIALPGAFTLTGTNVHKVCVRVGTDASPSRASGKPGEPGIVWDPGVACRTLSAE